jgi:hypothetical protein
MAKHILIIDDWKPCSANELIGCHWSTKHRKKAIDAQMVAVYALTQDIPRATGKRRLSFAVTVTGRTGIPDPDNLLKSLLDSLVACERLVDDSPRWLELGELRVARGDRLETRVELEDI